MSSTTDKDARHMPGGCGKRAAGEAAPGAAASDVSDSPRRRRGTRRARRERASFAPSARGSGGRYAPLAPPEVGRIHAHVLDILATVGLAEAPPFVSALVVDAGGTLSPAGRLLFPPPLIERALASVNKALTLHGQVPGHELALGGAEVHVGTGGAAPLIVDLDSGAYRESTLADLHDAARLVDALDNVHFFSRSLVARDMPNELLLDVNTAYASLAGTAKHVMVSAASAAGVRAIARICATIAGSEAAFRARPFLSLNINHVVPPLRYSAEACTVLAEAVRLGIPVHVNTFGQLGASSPVTIAGSVAQTLAETLAGLIVAWLLDADAAIVFGARPMVTDLRTGAMAGGSGEQALLTAASVQMARHYGLPNSTIAGASDAKIADAQSGYEKCLSVSLAAQSGCNLITQACGMQAGLMGCSFESYVIDDDMLGAVMRTLAPIDLSNEALSLDSVAEVACGEGHYLGHPETFRRMQSDFLYPRVADRRDHASWTAGGAEDIRTVANRRVRELLASHYPSHLAADVERTLRAEHDIRLPADRMRAG